MLSMENFGSWLLQELEKRNWSQSDLVRASGISRGTLSNIISGNRGIGEKSLIAIADALNISPITIFRKTGLLPPGSESVTFEDWQFILSQLSPEDEAELRQIAEIKIERRKKNRELKELKTRKAD
jgi:transcriptional regulator with XRE-family HTH domain